MNTLLLTCDNTNFPVSSGNNITDQIMGTFDILHHYRWDFPTASKAISNYRWNGQILWDNIDQALMGSHINNSFDLLCQKLLELLTYNFFVTVITVIIILEFLIKTEIYKKNLVISFLTVFRNAVDNIRKSKNCHIFCNNTDTSGVFGFQIFGNIIRRIIHLANHLLYTLPGGITNAAFMIYNIGNSRN